MALAGPAANFSLVIVAAVLIHAGTWMGAFEPPDSADFTHIVAAVATAGAAPGAATFLSVLFSLNLLLGTFNLLPLPPMDGFSAVGLLMGDAAAARFHAFGQQMRSYSMIGMLIAWRIFDPVFSPIFHLSLKALYPCVGYAW
jgi:Zn-dependent protease